MPGVSTRLKQALTGAYLVGSAQLTARLLRGRSGARDFQRVVVVAALGRHNGIAVGARLQAAALEQAGADVELLDATAALRNPLFRIAHLPGSTYVFHAGGPQTANLIASVLPHAARAWRVGYWAWELPDPPADWAGCDRLVSEVWTPSAFSRSSLSRLTSRPIHVVPHHLPAFPARRRDGAGPFTVLAMADSRSSLSRKNPEAALRAFHAAFGEAASARLVLKLNGRGAELDAFERRLGGLLRSANVTVVREHLDAAALARLYRSADALLSLHRAEGFGLPMLEAMAHGIPVVATGWSGNLDFMTPENSELVPCRLVPVQDEAAVYAASTWAEPDVDAAAAALRRLAEDGPHYDRMAAAAHARVADVHPEFPFGIPARANARAGA